MGGKAQAESSSVVFAYESQLKPMRASGRIRWRSRSAAKSVTE
jgi:hypothetical protein